MSNTDELFRSAAFGLGVQQLTALDALATRLDAVANLQKHQLDLQLTQAAIQQRQAVLQQALFELEQVLPRWEALRSEDPFVAGIAARLCLDRLLAGGVRPDELLAIEHKRALADVEARLEALWALALETPDGAVARRYVSTVQTLDLLEARVRETSRVSIPDLLALRQRLGRLRLAWWVLLVSLLAVSFWLVSLALSPAELILQPYLGLFVSVWIFAMLATVHARSKVARIELHSGGIRDSARRESAAALDAFRQSPDGGVFLASVNERHDRLRA